MGGYVAPQLLMGVVYAVGANMLQQDEATNQADASQFARTVYDAAELIHKDCIVERKPWWTVRGAIIGLYQNAGEEIPARVSRKLEMAGNLDKEGLLRLLVEARLYLGSRRRLEPQTDLKSAFENIAKRLDPYSRFIQPAPIVRQLPFIPEGIGLRIGIEKNTKEVRVLTPIKDSPAYRAGIKSGDVVTSITLLVDEEGLALEIPKRISLAGLSIEEVEKLIAGKSGTKVHLTISRKCNARLLGFDVVRQKSEGESVFGWRRNMDNSWNHVINTRQRIAYIYISTFAPSTAIQIRKVIKGLGKIKLNALIIDLRFNDSRLLDSGLKTARLFTDKDPIVIIQHRRGRYSYLADMAETSLTCPIICLVNQDSSGSSELVAACLQDHGKAIIAGERTRGIGTIQSWSKVGTGILVFTTALFIKPNGDKIDRMHISGRKRGEWGVLPNKGFVLGIQITERRELKETFKSLEIIPSEGSPKIIDRTQRKDRQLEMVLKYLQSEMEQKCTFRFR